MRSVLTQTCQSKTRKSAHRLDDYASAADALFHLGFRSGMAPPIFEAPNHSQRTPGLAISSTLPLIKIINSPDALQSLAEMLHNRCEHTTSGYEHDEGVLHRLSWRDWVQHKIDERGVVFFLISRSLKGNMAFPKGNTNPTKGSMVQRHVRNG